MLSTCKVKKTNLMKLTSPKQKKVKKLLKNNSKTPKRILKTLVNFSPKKSPKESKTK